MPTSNAVEMWICNGGANQVWTTQADGTIRAYGRCLDVVSGGVGEDNPVGLWDCNNKIGQQWIRRPDNTIYNTPSAKCLTATGGTDGAGLVIRTCSGQPEQQWRPQSNISGREGALTTALNPRCVDIPNADPNTTNLLAFTCNGNINQRWTLVGDNTVRAMSKCAEARGTTNDSTVGLGQCTGQSNQQWILTADSTLVNPISGRCLTPTSADSGAGLRIRDCTGQLDQTWQLRTPALSTSRVVGLAGRCLNVNDPNQGTVRLTECTRLTDQQWSPMNNGTFMTMGKCFDAFNGGTADLTPLVVWECKGNLNQQWVQRPDGSLVSPLSDKCADAGLDGAIMVLFTCNRGLHQRFATAVRPI